MSCKPVYCCFGMSKTYFNSCMSTILFIRDYDFFLLVWTEPSDFLPQGGGRGAPPEAVCPPRKFCLPEILFENNRKMCITKDFAPWKNSWKKASREFFSYSKYGTYTFWWPLNLTHRSRISYKYCEVPYAINRASHSESDLTPAVISIIWIKSESPEVSFWNDV